MPKIVRRNLNTAVGLLVKAEDSIVLDENPERTQKYIKKAKEICEKYLTGEIV